MMALALTYKKYVLNFKFAAGTSRGILKTKDSWIIKIYDRSNAKIYGIGEVSIIDRLSHDCQLDFDKELKHIALAISNHVQPISMEQVFAMTRELVDEEKPSIRFALETALLDLMNGGIFKIFDNDFYNVQRSIPINGLVWMGDIDFMQDQIDQKIEQGYKCIKLKIGALDFQQELQLLKGIRKKYKQLILRVDANGAFDTKEVLKRLDQLAELDIHSIEQPIMPRQAISMQLLCKRKSIPVALDEELIGVFGYNDKRELLEFIAPHYIVLKPSLHGGIAGTQEWITLAESLNIGWWITSALESNIGLNAVCQFTAEYQTIMHQGLGTGKLFENNFYSPLTIQGESVLYHRDLSWDHSTFDNI